MSVKLVCEPTRRRLRVFENRVLRRTFGCKRIEARREFGRKLHIGVLHNFYPSSHVIRMMKSSGTLWARLVACTV
jgi:uncharacterized protein Veg